MLEGKLKQNRITYAMPPARNFEAF